MDEAAIIEEFNRPTPRSVCFKQASPEAGVGFNPWHFSGELSSCSGIALGVLLVVAVIPAVRQEALIAAALFAGTVIVLALLFSSGSLSDVRHHRRLARYGEAVIGQVTSRTSVQLNDETPAPGTEITIEYEFRTHSGQELNGARATSSSSGWYKALAQNGRVVIVYLPDEPKTNEPYNSLRYRVCE